MTSEPEPTKNKFSNPTVIAAIIGAIALFIATIINVAIKFVPASEPNVYEVTINSAKYPFEKTPVEIQKGNDVEIIILGADSTVLNCGLGNTAVMGMVFQEYQPMAVSPTMNLCSVIGRIGSENSPYFFIGAYTQFTANTSGMLSLGINDVIPEKCGLTTSDCFSDNTGTILAHVLIYK